MFDPYLEWLKIPADHRPPTHYELLGISHNEADAAAIHKAVMERMALVRRYQLGEHAEDVLRLLNELSTAFNCLSDAERRKAYAKHLRIADETRKSLPRDGADSNQSPVPWAATADHAPREPARRAARISASSKRKARRPWLAAAAAAVAIAGAVIWMARDPGNAQQVASGSNRPAPLSIAPVSTDAGLAATPPELTESSTRIPGQQAEPVVPAPLQPRAGSDPSIRYFGYATAGPGKVIEKVKPYTNVVLIRDWVDRNNEVIAAADEAALPMVLCLTGKEMSKGANHLDAVLSRRQANVLAVCWLRPYFFGFTPTDVDNVGRKIKQAYPHVQFWIGLTDTPLGSSDDYPLMEVVDAVMVLEVEDSTPEQVLAKAGQVLPGWIDKAGGRPIMWCWSLVAKANKGIVPGTAPGTFRACLEVARKHQLAGLFFERYGDPKGQDKVPINRRPELVEEIRQIAGELGLETEAGNAAP